MIESRRPRSPPNATNPTTNPAPKQNMLMDYVRTGTYYAAIMENRADFEGKACTRRPA
jgi:hypothetical protein